ncbi:putative Aldo keto reductase family [Trypanosoma vivax]|uniref:Putative sugar transporter n=1 Tax=Trypanosoma vivax (strain Y486) TaxID=1055687 RepID=G0UB82_TRYVY|nr:putative sugar transporter [Trypanosoma vivax]KAH8606302.1 putative Aldo keto reductase family [Trypanosoma vivax]CCC53069.1 putative sugar transporter [Trypanosoma vivax Y486]
MFDVPFLVGCGGLRIPHIGIGTYELRGEECTKAVLVALQLGFRLIDTAAGYHNEDYVGAGIRESGVPRSELFVVVKIAPKATVSEQKVEESIRGSVRRLGIDYADCVLIHWPGCGGRKPHEAEEHKAARRRCWEVMSVLKQEGLVRHLGVSNFSSRHFAALSEDGRESSLFQQSEAIRPAINQIELHPLCTQKEVCIYCRERGIILQQYSPLGQCNPRLIEHPVLCEAVKEFPGYSVHSVLLMWGLSQGFCVIVRSRSDEHLKQNWATARDFFTDGALSAKQRERLSRLCDDMRVNDAEDLHFCWHSSNIE